MSGQALAADAAGVKRKRDDLKPAATSSTSGFSRVRGAWYDANFLAASSSPASASYVTPTSYTQPKNTAPRRPAVAARGGTQAPGHRTTSTVHGPYAKAVGTSTARPAGPSAAEAPAYPNCPHTKGIYATLLKRLEEGIQEWHCDEHDCDVCDLRALWMCLDCGSIGCGRDQRRHGMEHYLAFRTGSKDDADAGDGPADEDEHSQEVVVLDDNDAYGHDGAASAVSTAAVRRRARAAAAAASSSSAAGAAAAAGAKAAVVLAKAAASASTARTGGKAVPVTGAAANAAAAGHGGHASSGGGGGARDTRHAIAMELIEGAPWCWECNDWVLMDDNLPNKKDLEDIQQKIQAAVAVAKGEQARRLTHQHQHPAASAAASAVSHSTRAANGAVSASSGSIASGRTGRSRAGSTVGDSAAAGAAGPWASAVVPAPAAPYASSSSAASPPSSSSSASLSPAVLMSTRTRSTPFADFIAGKGGSASAASAAAASGKRGSGHGELSAPASSSAAAAATSASLRAPSQVFMADTRQADKEDTALQFWVQKIKLKVFNALKLNASGELGQIQTADADKAGTKRHSKTQRAASNGSSASATISTADAALSAAAGPARGVRHHSASSGGTAGVIGAGPSTVSLAAVAVAGATSTAARGSRASNRSVATSQTRSTAITTGTGATKAKKKKNSSGVGVVSSGSSLAEAPSNTGVDALLSGDGDDEDDDADESIFVTRIGNGADDEAGDDQEGGVERDQDGDAVMTAGAAALVSHIDDHDDSRSLDGGLAAAQSAFDLSRVNSGSDSASTSPLLAASSSSIIGTAPASPPAAAAVGRRTSTRSAAAAAASPGPSGAAPPTVPLLQPAASVLPNPVMATTSASTVPSRAAGPRIIDLGVDAAGVWSAPRPTRPPGPAAASAWTSALVATPKAAAAAASGAVAGTTGAPDPGSALRRRLPVILPGRAGMRNLGNTCYVNSVVQGMSHVHAFRRYFVEQFSLYSYPSSISYSVLPRESKQMLEQRLAMRHGGGGHKHSQTAGHGHVGASAVPPLAPTVVPTAPAALSTAAVAAGIAGGGRPAKQRKTAAVSEPPAAAKQAAVVRPNKSKAAQKQNALAAIAAPPAAAASPAPNPVAALALGAQRPSPSSSPSATSSSVLMSLSKPQQIHLHETRQTNHFTASNVSNITNDGFGGFLGSFHGPASPSQLVPLFTPVPSSVLHSNFQNNGHRMDETGAGAAHAFGLLRAVSPSPLPLLSSSPSSSPAAATAVGMALGVLTLQRSSGGLGCSISGAGSRSAAAGGVGGGDISGVASTAQALGATAVSSGDVNRTVDIPHPAADCGGVTSNSSTSNAGWLERFKTSDQVLMLHSRPALIRQSTISLHEGMEDEGLLGKSKKTTKSKSQGKDQDQAGDADKDVEAKKQKGKGKKQGGAKGSGGGTASAAAAAGTTSGAGAGVNSAVGPAATAASAPAAAASTPAGAPALHASASITSSGSSSTAIDLTGVASPAPVASVPIASSRPRRHSAVVANVAITDTSPPPPPATRAVGPPAAAARGHGARGSAVAAPAPAAPVAFSTAPMSSTAPSSTSSLTANGSGTTSAGRKRQASLTPAAPPGATILSSSNNANTGAASAITASSIVGPGDGDTASAADASVPDPEAWKKQSLSVQVSNTLRILWSGQWAVFTPAALIYAIKLKFPQFRGYQQQDAQEFFNCFVDELSEELRRGGLVVPAQVAGADAAGAGAGATGSGNGGGSGTANGSALAGGSTGQDQQQQQLAVSSTLRSTLLMPAKAAVEAVPMLSLDGDADDNDNSGSSLPGAGGAGAGRITGAGSLSKPDPLAAVPSLPGAAPAVTVPHVLAAKTAAAKPQDVRSTISSVVSISLQHAAAVRGRQPAPAAATTAAGRPRVPLAPPATPLLTAGRDQVAHALPRFPQSNIVSSVFGGCTRTSVTCKTCSHVSSRTENFNCLSVDVVSLAEVAALGTDNGNNNTSSNNANVSGGATTGGASAATNATKTGSTLTAAGTGGGRGRGLAGGAAAGAGPKGSQTRCSAAPAGASAAASASAPAVAVATAAAAAGTAAAAVAPPVNSNRGLPTDLLTCLRGLTKRETLAGDEAYHCEKCNAKVTAEKQLTLHTLPPSLVVHVNRAVWAPRGRREKKHTHVAFPWRISGDDLAPFLNDDSRKEYFGGSRTTSRSGTNGAVGGGGGGGAIPFPRTPVPKSKLQPGAASSSSSSSVLQGAGRSAQPITCSPIDASRHSSPAALPKGVGGHRGYVLRAVVEHRGRGIDTGHYLCHAHDDEHDCWLTYDDAVVKVTTEQEVAKAQAYLLFYEVAP